MAKYRVLRPFVGTNSDGIKIRADNSEDEIEIEANVDEFVKVGFLEPVEPPKPQRRVTRKKEDA